MHLQYVHVTQQRHDDDDDDDDGDDHNYNDETDASYL